MEHSRESETDADRDLRSRGHVGGVARAALGLARVLGVAFLLLGSLAPTASALPADESGCHVTPSIYCEWDGQRLDLEADTRFRIEWWNAHVDKWDMFYALRTRVRAKYTVKDIVTVFGEFQDTRIYDLGVRTSGAGSLYRRFDSKGKSSSTWGDDVRQAWLEVRPLEGLAIRGGRLDIKGGTEVMYPEPNWKYVKVARASQRLVGTVGWTHGERSNDAGTLSYDRGGYHLFVFGGNPTTGVFDVSGAYKNQGDIVYGGIQFTAKRDTWLPNTEVRSFFIGYGDDRPASDGGITDGLEIYSFGFSLLGIYPLGPGAVDLLVWGAGQGGEFQNRDHWAGAGVVEAGYQLTDVFAKPWIRGGLNIASGSDCDPATVRPRDPCSPSEDHNTFFNLLPTNHLYYGFADQLALQNLVNWFVQLKLQPHARVGLNFFFHWFRLQNDADAQYFGTGAFTKKGGIPGSFGYGANPSFGKERIATELDIVADVKLHDKISLQGGYSKMWGDSVWESNASFADDDVDFAYVQLSLRY
jgi:hypothetical protein